MWRSVRRLAMAWTVGCCLSAAAQSEEFRIETDVFVGNQREPIAQTLTLFTAGLVYDFPLNGPEEITVFDPIHGRFVLLDCRRKVKTTLSTAELAGLVAAMKAQAEQLGGVLAFAAEPQFRQHFDPRSTRVTLWSPLLTYRAKGFRPKAQSAVATYHSFADWYARLNALRPGNLPPFARIELNKALAAHNLIPQEVELEIRPKDRAAERNLVIRARHTVLWQITPTDRKRIERAGRHMVEFQSVGFRDYERELMAALTRRVQARK